MQSTELSRDNSEIQHTTKKVWADRTDGAHGNKGRLYVQKSRIAKKRKLCSIAFAREVAAEKRLKATEDADQRTIQAANMLALLLTPPPAPRLEQAPPLAVAIANPPLRPFRLVMECVLKDWRSWNRLKYVTLNNNVVTFTITCTYTSCGSDCAYKFSFSHYF